MTNATSNDKQENILKRSANAVIDLLSSFFLPIINLLVSVGILKGALTLLQVSGVVAADTTTYAILNGMADALFYFIPIFLAFTASKRFGVDTVTGMLIGCIILYPSITEIMAGSEPVYLFGLELQKATYSSSVIPILLAIYTASWVQKACYNVIPETFRGMFTPPITIVIVIPLTLGVFGPLGTLVGGWLATGYEFVYGLSPLVAGILIGAFQPFLVILGLHWALFTIAMNNVAVYGFDTIMALFGGAIFAQGGAALAVALKTKNKKFRSQAISASLTTLLGITEPAMYGVNLRLKKPMVCACVAGGLGSAVAGFFGCAGTAFALPALTTLPVFMSRAFIPFCISLAVAFGLAFIFTLMVPFNDLTEEEMAAEEEV
ncbi:PTS transporter subunit EIIC [Candidatus Collinsella stercoripullorum]|uniref:PTS transporter subunit EIIC n=1 Tax=Candidatus Collinsella stercoripullorum TaxID=2838522 RepID=UPI0022DFBE55|nr:PTS transporter subunit EIIC [Candidatus Collinsella stercoripullorum]